MSPAAGVDVVGVTGSGGFIGARLVERLRAGEVAVRTLSRSRVDLADADAVGAAVTGCGALVHCAFDFADLDANLAIARAVAQGCARAGVRLVHVSTAAVYEPFPDGAVDEDITVGRAGSAYAQAKRDIERALLRSAELDGLEVVILQPTVVYGPHGRAWTDSPMRELLTGTVVLPDRGEGLCNAVYIDDVCGAIEAALARPIASGARMLISGAAPVPWRDFYGAYGEMVGLGPVELAEPAPEDAALEDDGSAPGGSGGLKRTATRLLGQRVMSEANLALNFVRGLAQNRRHVPTGAKLALFRSRSAVGIDRARRLLGYEPQFDLARGMAATRPYVTGKYARLARIRRSFQ